MKFRFVDLISSLWMARFLCLFLFALTGRRRSRDPGRANLISNASLPGGILLPVFASRVTRIRYRTGSQITIVRWTLLPEELWFRMKFPCRSWYSIDRDAFTSMKILQNIEKAFISWSSVLKMGDEFFFFVFLMLQVENARTFFCNSFFTSVNPTLDATP